MRGIWPGKGCVCKSCCPSAEGRRGAWYLEAYRSGSSIAKYLCANDLKRSLEVTWKLPARKNMYAEKTVRDYIHEGRFRPRET